MYDYCLSRLQKHGISEMYSFYWATLYTSMKTILRDRRSLEKF